MKRWTKKKREREKEKEKERDANTNCKTKKVNSNNKNNLRNQIERCRKIEREKKNLLLKKRVFFSRIRFKIYNSNSSILVYMYLCF